MPSRSAEGLAWWHKTLREQGYRLTTPRRAVFDVLSKISGHPSAEEIYLEVHKSYPAIGLTTVYRTLELLVQMALVFRFEFGDGKARYEFSGGPKDIRHHHHLVCTNCGKIVDYTDFIEDEMELLNHAEEGLSRKFDFKITNHVIHFYGLCSKCRGKEQSINKGGKFDISCP